MNGIKISAGALLAALVLPVALHAADAGRDMTVNSASDNDCPIVCQYFPCCKPVATPTVPSAG